VTNTAVSLGEDLAVAAVATLVVVAPLVALGIAGALLAVGTVLLVVLWTRVRRGHRRLRAWRERRAAAA
jgi:membrane protein implicated in regulation of membrane protease activity